MTNFDDKNACNGEYIVEFVVIGNSVKATAFDPISLKEVSVIGSRSTPQKQLSALAVRKLVYMLNKSSPDEV